MKKFLVRSPAKINICLNVTGKREDGYHLLDMIILPLELHDSMLFSRLPAGNDNFVTIDDYFVGTISYNLVTSAMEKLKAYKPYKDTFRVVIHKNIPMQSGLGGGSSNSGAVINAVNEYCNLGMSDEDKIKIATGLGADVPFFVFNKPARCRGIGEKLDFINVKNDYYALIVKPAQGCSTQQVYEVSDTMDLPVGDVEKVKEALETGNDDLLAESIFNALEGPAISIVPEIQVIKNKLYATGLKIVQMTGSGSAVFDLSTDKKLIKHAARALEDQYLVEETKVIR